MKKAGKIGKVIPRIFLAGPERRPAVGQTRLRSQPPAAGGPAGYCLEPTALEAGPFTAPEPQTCSSGAQLGPSPAPVSGPWLGGDGPGFASDLQFQGPARLKSGSVSFRSQIQSPL